MRPHRICILGGCGAMGRVIVTCLRRVNPGLRVTVADRRPPSPPFPHGVRFVHVDLMRHAALVRVLRGHAIVINSTSHHFNLPVMRAALDARVHYLDLGGLFHFTRRQLKLDTVFRRRGLCAILGMGCAPGIANVLARWASEGMEQVGEIHIKVGGRTWGVVPDAMPYAVGTIREELTFRPAIMRRGRWEFPPPRSGVEHFPFPPPVGRQKIFRTIHSEVATLPRSFPGVREASFRIGFPDSIIRAALKKGIRSKVQGPRAEVPHPESKGQGPKSNVQSTEVRDCEITLALVRGRMDGRRVTRMASCAAWSGGGHSAGDWDTAWPPAIVADMVARGVIVNPGVHAPENIVPVRPFLSALQKAGFRLRRPG